MKNTIVLLVTFLCLSCTPTKLVQTATVVEKTDTNICENKAKLLDFTANSNCGYLFELEDGTKLLPSIMPNVNIPFEDGAYVLIAYKEYDEKSTQTKSFCGLENKVVELTCVREYVDPTNSKPITHDDCKQVKNVFTNEWMRSVTDKLKPQKIYEYDYAVGFLYLFNVNGINYLYDCLGNRMCDTNDGGDCSSLIETLGKGRLLQVMKN